MGTVVTTESLSELAKVLELFFKGLAECGLLTTYSVQLQGAAVDFAVQIKFQYLLSQFVKSLQNLLQKIPPLPGHEYTQEIGIQTSEQTNYVEISQSTTNVPEHLGSLVEACVFTQTQDPLPWVEDEEKGLKGFISQNKGMGTTDIIVTCHPAALAAIASHSFIATPITEVAHSATESILLKPCIESNATNAKDETKKVKSIVKSEEPPSTTTASNYMNSSTETSIESVNVSEIKPFIGSGADNEISNTLKVDFGEDQEIESLVLETYEEDNSNDCEEIENSGTNVMQIVLASSALSNEESPKNLTLEQSSEKEENAKSVVKRRGIFICEVCKKTFRSICSLEVHLSVKHRTRGECDLCDQRFTSVQSLQEHCRLQHGGKGCFNCAMCAKRFMTKLSFRRHMDTHGGKKRAVCDMCGKAFSRPDYLQKHYMTHTGHKPFQCTVCPRQFISSSQLKVHQRIHTGVKEHVCKICNKPFSRSDKLKDHMLRHLNIKRFHCTLCNRDYAEKRDLTKHLKVHANG